MRLTDQDDMLFLYHMRMTEEEYRWYDVLSSSVYVEEVTELT